jgi:hypothetical protein
MAGFDVSKDSTREDFGEGIDFYSGLHGTLDDLMLKVQRGAKGAESTLTDGNGRQWRITFCDMTDQKRCPFCDGTGVDGS